MAIFEVTIFKESSLYLAPGDVWANVYHVNAGALDNAVLFADAVAGLEQPLYSEDVTITRAYAKDLAHILGSIDIPIGDAGTRTALSNILPDWNVARVDWKSGASIRTMRKYLRFTCQAGDVANGIIIPDVVDVLQTYAQGVHDQTGVCTVHGSTLEGTPVVDTRLANRQTRWSRRARPGFHRGYIPNT